MRNTFIKLFIISSFFCNQTIYAQWNKLTTGTINNLYSVDYHSNGDVWIGSINGIFHSTNYANSIQFYNAVNNSLANTAILGSFDDVYGFSSTTAVAAGMYFMGNDELFFKTTNNGIGWTQTYLNSGTFLGGFKDLEFENSLTGLAVGRNGRIVKTTNAGNGWSSLSPGVGNHLYAVESIGTSTYVVSGDNLILRTTNGGSSWTTYTVSGSFISLGFSGNVGYAASDGGDIIKTVDGGVTWTTISTSTFGFITAMYVLSSQEILVATNDDLFISKNGGLYWECFKLPTYQRIRKIHFYDNTNGIAVGDYGYAIKTTNAGGNAYPIAKFSASQSSPCAGSVTTFTNSTDPSCTFQWLDNGNVVSTAFSPTLTFSAGTHTIKLVAYNGSKYDTVSSALSFYDPPVVAPYTVVEAKDSICKNTATTFTLQSSVVGVSYKMYKGNTQVGPTQNGNGANLVFSTGNLTQTSVFTFYGIRSNPCAADTFSLSKTIVVNYPSASLSYYINRDTVCIFDTTSLVILNSELGYTYKWSSNPYWNATNNPVAGTGGTLTIPLESVMYNYSMSLVAIHYSGCSYTIGPAKVLGYHIGYSDFVVTPNTILVDSATSFSNQSTMTTYQWDFGANSVPSSYYGITPPPITYTATGISSVTLTGIFQDSVCIRASQEDVHVFEPVPSYSIAECNRQSYSGNITIKDLALDMYGYQYMTGFVQSNDRNFFVVIKTDPSGNEIWRYSQSYSIQGGNSTGLGVAGDKYGNTYVSGTQTASSTFQGKTVYDGNFIIKFDMFGNIEWILTSSNSVFGDVVYSNKNNAIYSSGYYGSMGAGTAILPSGKSILFSDYYPSSHTGSGFLIGIDGKGDPVELDAFGKSSVLFHGVGFWCPIKMKEAPNGDLLFAGVITAAKDSTICDFGGVSMINKASLNSSTNISQIFTARYTPGAGFKSAVAVMGGNPIVLESFDVDKAGNIFFMGTAKSYLLTDSITTSLEPTLDPLPTYNFLIKTDSSGNFKWHTYTKFANFHDVATAPDSSVYILSSRAGFIGFYDKNRNPYGIVTKGGSDVGLVQYDKNGFIVRGERKGSTTADVAYQMESDVCGNLHAVELWNNSIYNFPDPIYCACPQTGNLKYVTYTHQTCGSNCFSAYNPSSKDVYVQKVFLDNSSTTGSGNRNILLKVQNFGQVNCVSARFYFQVNNDPVVQYNWLGNLSYGAGIDSLSIGAYNFGNRNYYKIKAWVELVNGSVDDDVKNDTAKTTQIICDKPIQGFYSLSKDTGYFDSFAASINTLSTCGIDATTAVNVDPGIYKEQLIIPKIPGVSANDTVIWKSATGDSTSVVVDFKPQWTGRRATVFINEGVSRLTFKGMTFRNTLAATYNNIFFVQDTNHYINFYNNRLEGIRGATQDLVLHPIPGANNFNRYVNNVFQYGSTAIDHYGHGILGNDTGLIIIGNRFENQIDVVIDFIAVDSPQIIDNTFISIDSIAGTGTWKPISLRSGKGAFKILNNDIRSYGVGGSIYGMVLIDNSSAIAQAPSLIANNFINNYHPSLTTCGYGITLSGSNNINVIHNTVGTGIRIPSGTGIKVRNNIFFSLANGLAVVNSTAGTNFDYNIYFADTNFILNRFGSKTYSQWRAAGYDPNSQWISPQFVSAGDLHLTPFNTFTVPPFPIVVDDFDRQLRNNPTMPGADEINPMVADLESVSWINPGTPTCGDSATMLQLVLKNNSNGIITNFKIYVDVTGPQTFSVVHTYSLNFSAGVYDTIWVGPFNTYQGGLYSFKAYTNFLYDTQHNNDTISTQINFNVKADAAFTYTVNSMQVDFTSMALNADSVKYDFNDGSYSTQSNPVHIYTSPGIYTICQIAYSYCNDTVCYSVNVAHIDMELTGWITQGVSLCGDSNTTLALIIRNNSNIAMNNFNVITTMTGIQTHSLVETYSLTISPSAIDTFYVGPFNTSSGGVYTFEAYVNLFSDVLHSNDTITTSMNYSPYVMAGFSYVSSGIQVTVTDGSANADSVHYDFGDGSYSNQLNPVHTYTVGGLYNLCQIAFGGCNDTNCNVINIVNLGLVNVDNALSMKIFPVPNEGIFTIQFFSSDEIDGKLIISDLLNKVYLEENINIKNGINYFTIQQNLPSGLYIIRLIQNVKYDSRLIEVIR